MLCTLGLMTLLGASATASGPAKGFYTNLGFGVDFRKEKFAPSEAEAKDGKDASTTYFLPSLTLGYKIQLTNRFFLSPEVWGGFFVPARDLGDASLSAYNLGFGANLGFHITDNLSIALKGGFEKSRYKAALACPHAEEGEEASDDGSDAGSEGKKDGHKGCPFTGLRPVIGGNIEHRFSTNNALRTGFEYRLKEGWNTPHKKLKDRLKASSFRWTLGWVHFW